MDIIDKRGTFRRVLFGIIFAFAAFLLIGGNQAKAAEDSPKKDVIRVGFPIQGGLTEKDENGNYSGYTYEYLQEIAQYTGWEYEFVEVSGNLNEVLMKMLDMLSKGEIDLLGGMTKNEYTQEQWDFPEYGYGFGYTTLVVDEKNTEINENNYQSVGNLKIGIYKKATEANGKLKAFLDVNNVEYTFVEYDTDGESAKALRRGEVDAAIGSSLAPTTGVRTVAQFDGSQFHFATQKGNAHILNALNRTILTIHQVKPDFESDLQNKYFPTSSGEVYLSEEEKAYIKKYPTLKIAFMDNIAPIQSQEADGSVSGIAVDVLEQVEKKTGLKFEYITVKDYEEASALLEGGKVDAICGLPYDYKMAQDSGLIMSNCFLKTQTALMMREGVLGDTDTRKSGTIDRMQSEDPDSDVIKFPVLDELLDALKSGEIDCAYMNLYSAEGLLRTSGYKDLRLVPQTDKVSDFCIGITRQTDPELVSLINRALAGISASEMEAIVYQNTIGKAQDVTVATFIRDNPFLVVTLVSILFALLAVIGGLILYFRVQSGKQLQVENQRYMQLSELANEFIYEYDCKKDKIFLSREFTKGFSLPEEIKAFKEVIKGEKKEELITDTYKFDMLKNIGKSWAEESDSEFLLRFPNGVQRWYRSTWGEIKDQEGKTIYIIGKLTDVQSEIEEKKELQYQLMLDGLTGVYNAVASRKLIEEKLQNLEDQGALLIMDIDRFKEVNDRLGHYIGDIVIREFAKLLTEEAGSHDIVGRLGGDEFVLFVHSVKDMESLKRFCENLNEKARRTYQNEEGMSCAITISIGGALVSESCEFTELYQSVDKELYSAKGKGRDKASLI